MKRSVRIYGRIYGVAVFLLCIVETVRLVYRLTGNAPDTPGYFFRIASVLLCAGYSLFLFLLLKKPDGEKEYGTVFRVIAFKTAFLLISSVSFALGGRFGGTSVPSMLIKSLYYAGDAVSAALGIAYICLFCVRNAQQNETDAEK